MKPQLTNEFNGYKGGTIVDVIMRGADGYEIKDAKTKEHIGFVKYEELADYIAPSTKITN